MLKSIIDWTIDIFSISFHIPAELIFEGSEGFDISLYQVFIFTCFAEVVIHACLGIFRKD